MSQFTINVKPVDALADRLDRIDPARLGSGALRAVNEVAVSYEAAARERITSRINLSEGYVMSKTDLVLAADPGSPTATLTVQGPRRPGGSGLTIMGRYDPRTYQEARGGKMRNAGVGVEVTRGDPKLVPQWFLLPLKRGNLAGGNGLGVFYRGAGDKSKFGRHIYGPSPYALTRRDIDRNIEGVESDLQRLSVAYVVDDVAAAI